MKISESHSTLLKKNKIAALRSTSSRLVQLRSTAYIFKSLTFNIK